MRLLYLTYMCLRQQCIATILEMATMIYKRVWFPFSCFIIVNLNVHFIFNFLCLCFLYFLLYFVILWAHFGSTLVGLFSSFLSFLNSLFFCGLLLGHVWWPNLLLFLKLENSNFHMFFISWACLKPFRSLVTCPNNTGLETFRNIDKNTCGTSLVEDISASK